MDRCGDDDSFGPVLGYAPDCYNFDFTLVFEDIIFSLAPCGIAILLAVWRLYDIVRQPVIVKWPLFGDLKLVGVRRGLAPFESPNAFCPLLARLG